MYCLERDCQDKVEFLCQECQEFQIFCSNHGISHSNIPFNHSIKYIDDEEIESIKKKLLEKEIDSKLSLIDDSSEIVINAFKAIEKRKILDMENNLNNNSQEDDAFDIKEYLSILISANIINQGKYLLEDEITQNEVIETELNLSIKKLSSELDNKSKEVENLKKKRDARLKKIKDEEDRDREIKEREMRKKKLAIHRGKNHLKFKLYSLEKKKEIAKNYWPFVDVYPCTEEILLSKDGKFVFTCKCRLGKFEADFCNLH